MLEKCCARDLSKIGLYLKIRLGINCHEMELQLFNLTRLEVIASWCNINPFPTPLLIFVRFSEELESFLLLGLLWALDSTSLSSGSWAEAKF